MDSWLTEILQLFVGRSSLIDSLIGLPLRNELIKAVPVAGCFVAAWYSGTAEQQQRRRKLLLVTLFAAIAASGLSRSLSERNSLPRPYILAHTVYRYQDGRIEQQPAGNPGRALDNPSVLRRLALAEGKIPENDFGSWPSDHASLFITLAVGICFAWPRAGVAALLWSCGAILLPKIGMGMHTLSDVLAGGLLGVVCFFVVRDVASATADRWLDRVAAATRRLEWLSSPLLFACLFEVCMTFDHLSQLAHAVKRHVFA